MRDLMRGAKLHEYMKVTEERRLRIKSAFVDLQMVWIDKGNLGTPRLLPKIPRPAKRGFNRN